MNPEMTAKVMELEPVELAAWRGMLKVHSALLKALDVQMETTHGLPLTSYEVLITLQAAPGRRLRMAELADRALLSRSGMTRLVDRLERDGLLERDVCSSDARGCYAVLTAKGDALLTAARPTHLDGVRSRFLDHLAPEDLQALATAFNKVLASNADLSAADLEKA